jgi:hypothetical protein
MIFEIADVMPLSATCPDQILCMISYVIITLLHIRKKSQMFGVSENGNRSLQAELPDIFKVNPGQKCCTVGQ